MEILKGGLGDRELHDTISKRLQYFKISRHNERAEDFVFNMALFSELVEPFVAANLIRTVCNAHPTARRFPKGGSHSACRFGCFAVGGIVFFTTLFVLLFSVLSLRLLVPMAFRISCGLLTVPFPLFLLEKVHIEDLIRTAI